MTTVYRGPECANELVKDIVVCKGADKVFVAALLIKPHENLKISYSIAMYILSMGDHDHLNLHSGQVFPLYAVERVDEEKDPDNIE